MATTKEVAEYIKSNQDLTVGELERIIKYHMHYNKSFWNIVRKIKEIKQK